MKPDDASSVRAPTTPTLSQVSPESELQHPSDKQLQLRELNQQEPKGAWAKLTHTLGDLPEYEIGRNGKMQGKTLNYAIGCVAACGFLMFGYDQGVMSGLLTLEDFQRALPLMTPYSEANPLCQEAGQCLGSPTIQAAGVAVYQIGCMAGAVGVLFWGDAWGRRSSTFWGSLLMIIGTAFQAGLGGDAGTSYALFCVGRMIGGIGNGCVTSTIPTWQAETAKPQHRGILVLLSGALIAFGIAVSYWVDYAFYFLSGSIRWRFPIAFQAFFTVCVMIGILFLPDSPRWLMMKGRRAEGTDVIARLAGKDLDHPEVQHEIRSVDEALRVQNAGGGFKFKELLDRGRSRNLQRTTIAVMSQIGQQIGGINLVTYYLSLLLEQSLGFKQDMSRLLAACNGTEYFLAALVALPLVERSGRRKLMMIGAAGMAACMAIIAGTVSSGRVVGDVPILDTAPGIVAVVAIFAFNSFFAVGWLGMSWLYPAEISNLRCRIQTNALSTLANWASNFVIVMITPPMLSSLRHNTYTIFSIINALIVPVVALCFPETKGHSLESLDVMFATAHSLNQSVVKYSLTAPRLQGEDLEHEMAKYLGDDPFVPRVSQGGAPESEKPVA